MRNHRLLSAVAMVKARGHAAAVDPHRPGAGAVRLAPDAPSCRQRAGLCRLRWGVRLYRLALVAGRGWRQAQPLRLGRGDHRLVRHADHRGGLGAGLSSPCVIAATFLNLNSCMVVDLLPYLSDILFCYDSVRNNDGYRDTCRPDGGDAAAYPSGAEDHPDAAVYRRYRQLS
ncbi:hypothetical protein KVMX100_121003 [Klebsiella variicola]|nr:hypothetical protein KVMX100_121003 [Klebsiella variicola]